MKSYRMICFGFLVFALGGCATDGFDRRSRDYGKRSPEVEAEADFRNGDRGIFSAMGFARYFPGLDHAVGSKVAAKHGEKRIPDTTDAPENRSQTRYIGAATRFAAAYNKRKIDLLENADAKN